MITTEQLKEFIKLTIAAINDGLADGCYRLRKATFSGEVALSDGTIVQQTVTTTPTGETISTVTEAPTTQTQETSDTMEANTQNGGDKISGSRVEVTEE